MLVASEGNPLGTRSTYGELRLDADWDPLRGDPRFEKIVASVAQGGRAAESRANSCWG